MDAVDIPVFCAGENDFGLALYTYHTSSESYIVIFYSVGWGGVRAVWSRGSRPTVRQAITYAKGESEPSTGVQSDVAFFVQIEGDAVVDKDSDKWAGRYYCRQRCLCIVFLLQGAT